MNMNINLLVNIRIKERAGKTAPSTGNQTVTNVHKRASVTIFSRPKSFILFLSGNGKRGKEYNTEIAPKIDKIKKWCN